MSEPDRPHRPETGPADPSPATPADPSGEASSGVEIPPVPAPSPGLPENASALRWTEFGHLIRRRWTWVSLVLAALGGLAITLAGGGGAGPGFVVTGIVAVIGLALVLYLADRRSTNAFYTSYADHHGLTWHGSGGSFDGTSSFLKRGDRHRIDQLFTGRLADGIEGSLALYTYTVVDRDSDGTTKTDYPFTVITVPMPAVREHMANLKAEPRVGPRALQGFTDRLRLKEERVSLESEALDRRYNIFVGKGQDPVWTRRLFSPSFIVWLAEKPPKQFGFELEDGYFVAWIPKHRRSAAGLDEMRHFGCQVAGRLLDEVAETV